MAAVVPDTKRKRGAHSMAEAKRAKQVVPADSDSDDDSEYGNGIAFTTLAAAAAAAEAEEASSEDDDDSSDEELFNASGKSDDDSDDSDGDGDGDDGDEPQTEKEVIEAARQKFRRKQLKVERASVFEHLVKCAESVTRTMSNKSGRTLAQKIDAVDTLFAEYAACKTKYGSVPAGLFRAPLEKFVPQMTTLELKAIVEWYQAQTEKDEATADLVSYFVNEGDGLLMLLLAFAPTMSIPQIKVLQEHFDVDADDMFTAVLSTLDDITPDKTGRGWQDVYDAAKFQTKLAANAAAAAAENGDA